jgi:predicted nucleic acid-binding protein
LIHLDTCFLIRALGHGSPEDRALREWLTAGEEIGISAVAWGQFLCGPLGPDEAALAAVVVGDPLALDAATAALAAELFNRCGRRRGSIVDCFIAACALSGGARLATTNPADFRRFADAGLVLAEV